MEIVSITIQQIIKMFILILVGVLCFKVKLLDTKKSKTLSDLLIKVITPALIITSFQRDFEAELVRGFVLSLILTAFSLGLAYIVVRILIRKNEKYDAVIDRFGAMYSNCGFMGIPLAYGVLGSEGVFYIVGFNLLFDLLVFSVGERTMKGEKANGIKEIIKQMINPATVASIIGVIMFVFQIRIPEIIASPISMIADMNTPTAMLAAGVSVAQTNIKKLLKNGRLYYVCAIKLLIIPIIFALVLKWFPIPETVYMTTLLATACPSATLTVLYSVMYGRDDVYASEIFSATTILSIITIPLVVAIGAL